MLQDLRFTLRGFGRQRTFFLTATLTIALGVALTTTMFSVADNLLYRPLPYARAQQLYEIFGANRGDSGSRVSGAVGDYLAWRGAGVFSQLGVFRYPGVIALTGGQEARHVLSVEVDDQLLSTLGVQPALGRGISAADVAEGARPVLMISHGLWQREFGGDASVVGRVIDANSAPAEIVGVLPSDFIFPASVLASTPQPIDILRPLIVPASQRLDHNRRGYRTLARLAPNIPLNEVQARLDALQDAMKPLFRPSNVRPGAFDGVRLVPLQASMVGRPARQAVMFLLMASFGVLLVAAVNVANMLLARGSERERELAVRAAIGASRARLARLLLVESAVLSLAGGSLGLLTARAAFDAILSQIPQRFIVMRAPEIDLRVGLFALAVSLGVCVVFGLMPAVQLSRADSRSLVKAGQTATRRAGWGRDVLVFAEIGLTVVLVGAGTLVLRSFANAVGVEAGMDAPRVLTLQVTPPARIPAAADDARAAFFRSVLERVQSIPGVEAAALTDNPLMQGGNLGSSLGFDGVDSKRIYTPGNQVSTIHVTPDYFRVMGMQLRGSAFPSGATGDESLAITSARAGRYAGVDPLGRTILSLQKDESAPARRYRVVGVAPDVHERGLDSDPLSVFYLPFSAAARPTLLVRAMFPGAMAAAVREGIHSVDRTAVIDQVRPLDELIYRSLAERRFNAFLYGAFSLSALVLSGIGVYGVIAYAVSRRTREIGIRIALGATSERIVLSVTRRLVAVLSLGVSAGLATLLGLGSALRALVFNVQPSDPVTLATATTALTLVAVGAAYLPARRAARVDPMIALRAE